MHTSKSLLLFIFFSFSLFVTAQIGSRKHILSNGDTTLVVNRVSGGLKDPDAQFLLRRSIPKVPEDSIFPPQQSSFSSLEEAALAVNRLLGKVGVEQALSRQEGNDGLGFRLSQLNRRNMRKDAEARSLADSLLSVEAPVSELVDLYAKFGNRPTYYINGVVTEEKIVNRLLPSEILRKELRVINTLSGNPNGEVWYDVSAKGIERLKLTDIMIIEPINEPLPANTIEFIITPATNSSSSGNSPNKMEEVEIKIKENGQERSVKGFKPSK